MHDSKKTLALLKVSLALNKNINTIQSILSPYTRLVLSLTYSLPSYRKYVVESSPHLLEIHSRPSVHPFFTLALAPLFPYMMVLQGWQRTALTLSVVHPHHPM